MHPAAPQPQPPAEGGGDCAQTRPDGPWGAFSGWRRCHEGNDEERGSSAMTSLRPGRLPLLLLAVSTFLVCTGFIRPPIPEPNVTTQTDGLHVVHLILVYDNAPDTLVLIYFGARYYDPAVARFITQDSYLGFPRPRVIACRLSTWGTHRGRWGKSSVSFDKNYSRSGTFLGNPR